MDNFGQSCPQHWRLFIPFLNRIFNRSSQEAAAQLPPFASDPGLAAQYETLRPYFPRQGPCDKLTSSGVLRDRIFLPAFALVVLSTLFLVLYSKYSERLKSWLFLSRSCDYKLGDCDWVQVVSAEEGSGDPDPVRLLDRVKVERFAGHRAIEWRKTRYVYMENRFVDLQREMMGKLTVAELRAEKRWATRESKRFAFGGNSFPFVARGLFSILGGHILTVGSLLVVQYVWVEIATRWPTVGVLLLLFWAYGVARSSWADWVEEAKTAKLVELSGKQHTTPVLSIGAPVGEDGTTTTAAHKISEATDLPDRELAPGDTIRLGEVDQIPADCVLLVGSVAVNEATLTGECAPVQKVPASADAHVGSLTKKNLLFASTKVLQCSPDAVAVIVKTGGQTRKGVLLKQMVFDEDAHSKMSEELTTVIPWISLAVGVLFAINTTVQLWQNGVLSIHWAAQVFRVYQLAVMVMSPAILTALNSAARAAKHRLGRSIVFCHGGENEETIRSIHVANPTSIPDCAGVQVMCLDKTGTVTEPGLQLVRVEAAPAGVSVGAGGWQVGRDCLSSSGRGGIR